MPRMQSASSHAAFVSSLRVRFGASVADGCYPVQDSPSDRLAWLGQRLDYLLALPKRTPADDVSLRIARRRHELLERPVA